MFRYLLALAITATSLLGPMPCCCMFGGHHHETPDSPADSPCCCQAKSPQTIGDGVPRFDGPDHRCRCDHSKQTEPLAVTRTAATEPQKSHFESLCFLQYMVEPFVTITAPSSTFDVPHSPTGQAKLRALHVMRC